MNNTQRFCSRALLFLAIGLLAGCKKDSPDQTRFPLNFYAEKAEVHTETRVYTKSGEIIDPVKIQQLIRNVKYFRAEDNQPDKGSLYLSFESKDSVLFGSNDFKFKVQQSGEQFLFTSSLIYIQSLPAFDNIRYHILKYENIVRSEGGQTSKEVKIAYGNYQELKLPIFAYRISSSLDGTPRTLYRYDGMVNNEFNESSLSMLRLNDTIAVKKYTLTLKAK